MGLKPDFLKCAFTGRWFDLDDSCSCGIPECGKHHELCGITPIYASLVLDFGCGPVDIASPLIHAELARTQTLINCAECGRAGLAKDMLVIYQAPLNYHHPQPSRVWKYPKNIVKAVCPEHNRQRGTIYGA